MQKDFPRLRQLIDASIFAPVYSAFVSTAGA
jgi:hypothetical protein